MLSRLEHYRGQVASNRKDLLGQADASALTLARARQQDRVSSLGRLGHSNWDIKSYREMVARIKDRGSITGAEFARTGVEGEVKEVRQENALRPAFVSVPELPKETTAGKPAEERKVQAPAFKTHRFIGIPFVANDAITIDGDLSDWKDIPPLELDPVLKGSEKTVLRQPAHQTGYVAFCPRGLLVAVDVVDTTRALENHRPMNAFWLNDCVEIYVDTLNTKARERGEANTHQFFAFPFGHRDDQDTSGYEAYMGKEGKTIQHKIVRFKPEVMPRAAKKTEKGWTLELLIPRSALRQGGLQPGRIIGFNLQIDTGSDLYYYWTANIRIMSSIHPNTWGDVQLLGSDGKIDLVGADGKELVQSILPGQPIRVRVTDPDMNLNDRKKDKVSVTLKTAGGVNRTLLLEETEPASGVFVGAMPTCLNIGGKLPEVLEVFEGETVTVEYLDQVRAYGERNVPVKAVFAVSSIGLKLVEK